MTARGPHPTPSEAPGSERARRRSRAVNASSSTAPAAIDNLLCRAVSVDLVAPHYFAYIEGEAKGITAHLHRAVQPVFGRLSEAGGTGRLIFLHVSRDLGLGRLVKETGHMLVQAEVPFRKTTP